jgi:transposase
LDAKGVEAVRTLLEQRPDSTLPELVSALAETYGITVSRATVGRTVRERLGWTRKKVHRPGGARPGERDRSP